MSMIRAQFFKKGVTKYISHLDLMRTIQRAVRRAALPIEYSKGYNPHSKIAYGPALALGVSSDGEFLDMEFKEHLTKTRFIGELNANLPTGLGIIAAEYVPDGALSLTAIINAAEYVITGVLGGHVVDAKKHVRDFFDSEDMFIERVNKRGGKRTLNIMPLISDVMSIDVRDKRLTIRAIIDTGSRSNLRPTELIDALERYVGVSLKHRDIHRKKLLIRRNGAYFSPLEIFN